MSVAFSDIDCQSGAVELPGSLGLALSPPALSASAAGHPTLGPAAPLAPGVGREGNRLVGVVGVQQLLGLWSQCKRHCIAVH